MDRELIGWAFILPAGLLLAPLTMAGWYKLLRSAEKVRAMSAMTIMISSPLFTFATLGWRWDISQLGDSPAAGIPIVAGFYEMFWIWCVALAAVLLMHGHFVRFEGGRSFQNEMDCDLSE